MMKTAADFFDRMAGGFGLPFKMPRPGKAACTISAFTNGMVGVGLITAGALRSSKALIGLGVIGIAGAILLGSDK